MITVSGNLLTIEQALPLPSVDASGSDRVRSQRALFLMKVRMTNMTIMGKLDPLAKVSGWDSVFILDRFLNFLQTMLCFCRLQGSPTLVFSSTSSYH